MIIKAAKRKKKRVIKKNREDLSARFVIYVAKGVTARRKKKRNKHGTCGGARNG